MVVGPDVALRTYVEKGAYIVGKVMGLLSVLVMAIVVTPLIEGCCMPATNNPIAAATAGAKVLGAVDEFQNASTPEEQADAVVNIAQTITTLSTSEIASAVNLVAQQGWSLEDAQEIKNLAAQVDEESIDALIAKQDEFEALGENPQPSDVVPIVEEAGIEVTEKQVELLQNVLDSMGEGGFDLSGLGV